MADRKQPFSFRFWLSGNGASSRRTPATQTTAPPPATATSKVKPEALSRQSTTTPTAAAPQTPANHQPTTTSAAEPEALTSQSTASKTNSTTTAPPPPAAATETPATSQPTTTNTNPNPITTPTTTTTSIAEPEALTRQSTAIDTTTTPPPLIPEPETSASSQPTTTNTNPNPITAPTTTITSTAEPEALTCQSTTSITNSTTTTPPLPTPEPETPASSQPPPAPELKTPASSQPITTNTNPNPITTPTTTATSIAEPEALTGQSTTSNANSTTKSLPPPTAALQTPASIQPNTTTTAPTKEVKTANQPNINPKTSSPPSRRTTQSRSPPQPSSPARGSPKTRPTPPSPSRVGPTISKIPSTSQTARSPSRLTAPSPKKTPSNNNSPSKESRQITQEKPPSSVQQEPRLKAEAKSHSANGLVESNPQPQETKGVKEVDDFLSPKSMQTENTLASPVSAAKPTTTDDKSAPPIGDRHVAQFHKGVIKDDVSTLLNRAAISDDTKGSTFYDRAGSVITLAGENRGASMHVGPDSSNRDGPVHIHRSYNKINPDENIVAEESSSEKQKSEDARQDKPTEAYINNNAQGINNSIVFNGSITERNPGVHMAVTHVAKEPVQSTNDDIAPEARKAEFNTTRAEKLTYEPTIRRRCLRGLFLETSDSDNDNNLEKPRRHGCRVGCQQIRDKEKDNIDVV